MDQAVSLAARSRRFESSFLSLQGKPKHTTWRGTPSLQTSIVTEPPKLLGPPIVVLVQRTSDNPIGAPESLDKFGICFSYLSKERFTRHADITNHRRYENAEAIT
jgi:hypothetical protein